MDLMPHLLEQACRRESEALLRAYDLPRCIECGACSYVCPARIPQAQHFRAAKLELLRAKAPQDEEKGGPIG